MLSLESGKILDEKAQKILAMVKKLPDDIASWDDKSKEEVFQLINKWNKIYFFGQRGLHSAKDLFTKFPSLNSPDLAIAILKPLFHKYHIQCQNSDFKDPNKVINLINTNWNIIHRQLSNIIIEENRTQEDLKIGYTIFFSNSKIDIDLDGAVKYQRIQTKIDICERIERGLKMIRSFISELSYFDDFEPGL